MSVSSSTGARAAGWPLRTLILIWLGWFVVLYAFQAVVPQRLTLRRPDFAAEWTAGETAANSQNNKPYLLEPFLNAQVSWDSEYYLSIALGGYDDPAMRLIRDRGTGQEVSQNFAFFPLYPLLMRTLLPALWFLDLTPIATASLAGVAVALLGTLAGLIALWDLTRSELGEADGLRAVAYLLIFPTGFFLAMVYTEGLFLGLSFTALALSRRKQWLWASLVAGLAPWTRAHGAALALPLVVAWLQAVDWKRPLGGQFSARWLAQGALALLPLASYLVWRLGPMGQSWAVIQVNFFQRGLLDLGGSLASWQRAFAYAGEHGPALVYMGLEVFTVALAALAGLALLRRAPAVALYSLALVAVSVFSGVAQSMARYMLVAPATYLVLAWLGRRPAFDRVWSLASTLAMGLTALLFAFDMWVG
ncbi:MAG: hypothetical protein JNK29_02470 [Anaerolineales bacterium]|nr:hypothetical protein [Anaerolineales bacterium]